MEPERGPRPNASGTRSDALERPLDGFERRYWLLGAVMPYTFSIVAHLRGHLEPEHLRAGLAAAQQRHPMLRARVEARSDGPWWTAAEGPIPLAVERRRDDAHWERIVEREDNAGYGDEGPLQRAVLLQGEDRSDLNLNFHHLTADGLASFVALRDILAFAARAKQGEALKPEPLPMPRGMCGLLPPEARGPEGQAALAALVSELEYLKTAPPARLTAERTVPPVERTTRIVHRGFDAAFTTRLAARARAEGASVTGALAAAHLQALAHEIGLKEPRTLGLNVPANLRQALAGPDAEGVDWYAFGLPMFHKAGPGVDFWDLARTVRGELARPELMLRRYAVLAFIDQGTPRTLDAAPQEVAAAEGFGLTAGSVSNIGKLGPLPDYAGVTVEGLEITGNQNLGGPTFLQVPLTWDGKLALNFHHAEPLVSRARGARLADDVVARVRAAVA